MLSLRHLHPRKRLTNEIFKRSVIYYLQDRIAPHVPGELLGKLRSACHRMFLVQAIDLHRALDQPVYEPVAGDPAVWKAVLQLEQQAVQTFRQQFFAAEASRGSFRFEEGISREFKRDYRGLMHVLCKELTQPRLQAVGQLLFVANWLTRKDTNHPAQFLAKGHGWDTYQGEDFKAWLEGQSEEGCKELCAEIKSRIQ